MLSVLLIGLLIGMRHAVEADHVAAMASIVCDKPSFRQALTLGGVWGLGHSLALCLFGSVVLSMNTIIPETLAQTLELAVGILMLALGGDVLRRLRQNKIHLHRHRHNDGKVHFHAHSHAGESPDDHTGLKHEHCHSSGFPVRALLIGLMHGMAGSAVVIMIALGSVTSSLGGILYLLAFGTGSIIGMALLSVAISIPLHFSAGRLKHFNKVLQICVGISTICLGLLLLYQQSALLIA